MKFETTEIGDVVLITPKKIGDGRGYFMETYKRSILEEKIGPLDFVQDNQSLSVEAGTVRGLHFQTDPMAQGKLVRCVAGALLDVAVDLRLGSPTYGHHVAVELSAENGRQLWVPPGFAHGFCTTMPNTEISYKVTNYYSAEHDRGLLWNDPAIGIKWPVDLAAVVLSEKDRNQPSLAEVNTTFKYEHAAK